MFKPGSRSEVVLLVSILGLLVVLVVLVSVYWSWKIVLLVIVGATLSRVPLMLLIQLAGFLMLMMLAFAVIFGIG